jgi:hypothetical protein
MESVKPRFLGIEIGKMEFCNFLLHKNSGTIPFFCPLTKKQLFYSINVKEKEWVIYSKTGARLYMSRGLFSFCML